MRKIRIKPYLDLEDVEIIEQISKNVNLSLGAVITKILYESKTFNTSKKLILNNEIDKLKEVYYSPIYE